MMIGPRRHRAAGEIARARADAGRRPARGRWGAGLAAAGLLLAACSSELAPIGPAAPARAAGTTQVPTATASPSPTPAVPTTSPLSGRRGGVGTPVLVVKLDNTASAQPHVGLSRADIVYVEPVEWGLTRLAAVFSTTIPELVGPVRSARIGDIEVFAPFGDVAFVHSGAQSRLVPRIAAAPWRVVSEELGSPGFLRDSSRPVPYNLMAQPQRILRTSGATAVAQDMGWVFQDDPRPGGRRARLVTATWDDTRLEFRWNGGSYDVWMDGRQARDTQRPGVQRASTVVVQYVRESDSGYGDRFGGRTPIAQTVGSGAGLVLRDGRAHRITWRRGSAEEPTAYLDQSGQPIAFAPGQVWILLKDRTRKVSVE